MADLDNFEVVFDSDSLDDQVSPSGSDPVATDKGGGVDPKDVDAAAAAAAIAAQTNNPSDNSSDKPVDKDTSGSNVDPNAPMSVEDLLASLEKLNEPDEPTEDPEKQGRDEKGRFTGRGNKPDQDFETYANNLKQEVQNQLYGFLTEINATHKKEIETRESQMRDMLMKLVPQPEGASEKEEYTSITRKLIEEAVAPQKKGYEEAIAKINAFLQKAEAARQKEAVSTYTRASAEHLKSMFASPEKLTKEDASVLLAMKLGLEARDDLTPEQSAKVMRKVFNRVASIIADEVINKNKSRKDAHDAGSREGHTAAPSKKVVGARPDLLKILETSGQMAAIDALF